MQREYSGEHLSIEDYEKYISTEDMSDEYLLWFEKIENHLEECSICQAFVEKMMQVDAVAMEESWAAGLRLLEQEEELRAKLVAQKLILAGMEERMRTVIALLNAGRAESMLLYKKDLLRRQVMTRGSEDTSAVKESGQKATKVCAEYTQGHIRVKVFYREAQDFTVILVPEGGAAKGQPIVEQAVWSEQEKAAVAEFETQLSEDEYRIYLA